MHQDLSSSVAGSVNSLDVTAGSRWLREIAQGLTVPSAEPGKWAVPQEVVGEQLTRNQIEKFKAFEAMVVLPLALKLREMDPDAEVLISGSYKNNPDGVRLWSDIDVIVLSRILRNPEQYIECLAALHSLGRDYHLNYQDQGARFHPVFFTRATGENFFQYCAAQMVMEADRAAQGADALNGQFRSEPDYSDYARVLPCHALFYSDSQELLDREPEYLGKRLLKGSQQVLDSKPDLFFAEKRVHNLSVLQNTLWDVERCTAELILNQGFLKNGMLGLHYANAFYQSVRFLADHVPINELTVEGVLSYLDRDKSQALWNSFAPIVGVRQEGPHYPLDGLLLPATKMISACRSLIASNESA